MNLSIQQGFNAIRSAHKTDDEVAQRARDGATLAGVKPVDEVHEIRIKRALARRVAEISAHLTAERGENRGDL